MLPYGEELTEKEIRKEIRKLRKSLSRRVTNIEKSGLKSQYATVKYRELDKEIRESRILQRKKVDPGALYHLLTDLRYVDQLKSSTVAGAKKSDRLWKPIEERIDQFEDKDVRAKLFNIWQRSLSRDTAFALKVKYNIFSELLNDVDVSRLDLTRDEKGRFVTGEDEEYIQDLLAKYTDTIDRAYTEMKRNENNGKYETVREADNDFVQIFSRLSKT